MPPSEPARTAVRRTRAPWSGPAGPATGITVYGCTPDEAALFRETAPRFGVVPTLTEAPVSEATVALAAGNRCLSVGHKTPITNSTLLALSQAGVAYISTRSIGYDHIDVTYAESVGISVENVAYSPDGVADYTLMLMLMAVRHAKSVIRRADVHDYRLNAVRGKELRDLTVGVVGTGRIGSAVMDRLRGFGCRILAHDNRPKPFADYVPLDELLRAERHRDAPHAAHRGHPPPPRPPAHRADEARRVRRQHRTRLPARHRGAHFGVGKRQPGRRGAGRPRRRRRNLLRRPPGQTRRKQAAAAAASAAERAHQPAHRLPHGPRPERHRRKLHRQLPEIRERKAALDIEDRHHLRRHFRRTPRLRQVRPGGREAPRPREVRTVLDRDHEVRRLEAVRQPGRRLGKRPLPAGRAVAGPERPRPAGPGRGRLRNDQPGRRAPRPARQARRGRRDAGFAGALRHPLRRLRHLQFRAVHGQVPGLRRRRQRGHRHAELLDRHGERGSSIPASSPIPSSSSRPARGRRSASARCPARKSCRARWRPRGSTTRRC